MIQLKDICDIYDCPHTTAKDEGKGYPLVRTPNVGKGRLILNGIHRVSEDVYNSRNARAIPEEGDLILAREAPVGNVSIIMDGQRVCLGQRVVLIKPKRELVDPHFLTYYLLSAEVQHRLKNHANGAVVAHLNVPDIRNLWVTLPEFEEQVAIGKILRSIDDKIELNRQINDNLEQQIQALYQAWFIDLVPFNGVRPNSWNYGLLSDLLTLQKETIKPHNVNGMPYLPIDAIPMRCLGINRFAPSEEALSSLQKFYSNDIVIGAMRVYFHRVIIAPCEGITRNTNFILRPNTLNTLAYCLCLCNQKDTIDFAQATSKGTTMPYAVWEGGLANMPITIPDKNILNEFETLVMPLISSIRDSYLERIKLEQLRDSLLPKLMSGELIINEIDC